MPSLAKICQRRDEESVQETLAVAITKLMPVLGQFTNDKEIKVSVYVFICLTFEFKYYLHVF